MLLAMGKKLETTAFVDKTTKHHLSFLAEKKRPICTDNEKLSTHFSPQKFYQSRIFTNSVEGL